jgi:pyruvate dehydrogenase E2 component (dihydrolipoamide acetyltransferase)
MSIEFHMPQLGITMEEATIVRWLRDDGARVQQGEAIVEVETDKTTAEVESTATGTLRIIAQEGDVVQAGAILAYIETQDAVTVIREKLSPVAASEALQENLPTDDAQREIGSVQHSTNPALPSSPHPRPGPPSSTQQDEERPVRAAPAARTLARQLGVNLTEVKGSGPGGRIMPADVEAFAASTQHFREPSPQPATSGENDKQQMSMLQLMGPERETIPLKGIRRTIFFNVTRSMQTTAPCSSTIDVDMSEVVQLRERVKANEQNTSIGMTAIVARALVIALAEFPSMNALALEDGLHLATNINLGIAMDTSDGLIVPVIRGIQSLTLQQIHQAIRAISVAVPSSGSRNAIDSHSHLTGKVYTPNPKGSSGNALGPDDFAGGTFTLSNLGPLPIRSFAPILNAPQVGIVGIAGVQERVVVIEHQMVIRPMLTLNLTFDHRWIDGRPAALFLCRVKEILEHANGLL